jgi:hypothetical protein
MHTQYDIQEAIEERAAIREYDGGQGRMEAMRDAKQDIVVYRYRLAGDPKVWHRVMPWGGTKRAAIEALRSRYSYNEILEVSI